MLMTSRNAHCLSSAANGHKNVLSPFINVVRLDGSMPGNCCSRYRGNQFVARSGFCQRSFTGRPHHRPCRLSWETRRQLRKQPPLGGSAASPTRYIADFKSKRCRSIGVGHRLMVRHAGCRDIRSDFRNRAGRATGKQGRREQTRSASRMMPNSHGRSSATGSSISVGNMILMSWVNRSVNRWVDPRF